MCATHNTRNLVTLLLYAIWRVLQWSALDEVVIVDNGSSDGSPAMLTDATSAGLCTLLANNTNRQHGPALNQAMSYLASRAAKTGEGPGWVWILDSDCVIARPDALSKALQSARGVRGAVVGEYQHDPWHGTERFGNHCLLIDPARVWRDPVRTFEDCGDPAFALLQSAEAAGLPSVAFPFLASGYVIHRGRGTLAAVVANEDRSNPYYAWAVEH